MTILRSGPSKRYASNWASAFGKKKKAKSTTKSAKASKGKGKAKKASKKK